MSKGGFRGKNVRHFRLVNRSVLDENDANKDIDRVFVEVDAKGMMLQEKPLSSADEEEEVDVDSVPQAGEAAKYGIFFDDRSYDYTKHLRPIGQSPDAVFVPASKQAQDSGEEYYEEEEEYYEDVPEVEDDELGVREVLEALDDEEYCDEDFDDNLIVKLNRDDDARVLLQSFEDSDDYFSEAGSDDESEAEEPVFNGVQQLDEIRRQLKDEDDGKFMSRIRRYEEGESDGNEDQYIEVVEEVEDRFDCQSILSTLNTGINLPNLIRDDDVGKPIRLSNRTGLPSRLSTVVESETSDDDDEPAVNKGAARKRDETAEEKRARKAAAKAEAKEKRQSKKNRQK